MVIPRSGEHNPGQPPLVTSQNAQIVTGDEVGQGANETNATPSAWSSSSSVMRCFRLRPRRSRRQHTSTSTRRRVASAMSRSSSGRRSFAPLTPRSMYSTAVQPRASTYRRSCTPTSRRIRTGLSPETTGHAAAESWSHHAPSFVCSLSESALSFCFPRSVRTDGAHRREFSPIPPGASAA